MYEKTLVWQYHGGSEYQTGKAVAELQQAVDALRPVLRQIQLNQEADRRCRIERLEHAVTTLGATVSALTNLLLDRKVLSSEDFETAREAETTLAELTQQEHDSDRLSPVSCSWCGATVPKAYSEPGGTGPLCLPCATQLQREVGPSSDASESVFCEMCQDSVPRQDAVDSMTGPLCPKCAEEIRST